VLDEGDGEGFQGRQLPDKENLGKFWEPTGRFFGQKSQQVAFARAIVSFQEDPRAPVLGKTPGKVLQNPLEVLGEHKGVDDFPSALLVAQLDDRLDGQNLDEVANGFCGGGVAQRLPKTCEMLWWAILARSSMTLLGVLRGGIQ